MASVESMSVSIKHRAERGAREILVRTRAPGPLAEWVDASARVAVQLGSAFEGWRVDRLLLERNPGKGSRPTVELVLRQSDRNTAVPSEDRIAAICAAEGL